MWSGCFSANVRGRLRSYLGVWSTWKEDLWAFLPILVRGASICLLLLSPTLPTLDYLHHLVTKGENNSPAVSGFLSCQHKNLITQRETPDLRKDSQHAHFCLYHRGFWWWSWGVPLPASTSAPWSYSKDLAFCCCYYSFSFCITGLLNISHGPLATRFYMIYREYNFAHFLPF